MKKDATREARRFITREMISQWVIAVLTIGALVIAIRACQVSAEALNFAKRSEQNAAAEHFRVQVQHYSEDYDTVFDSLDMGGTLRSYWDALLINDGQRPIVLVRLDIRQRVGIWEESQWFGRGGLQAIYNTQFEALSLPITIPSWDSRRIIVSYNLVLHDDAFTALSETYQPPKSTKLSVVVRDLANRRIDVHGNRNAVEEQGPAVLVAQPPESLVNSTSRFGFLRPIPADSLSNLRFSFTTAGGSVVTDLAGLYMSPFLHRQLPSLPEPSTDSPSH